MRKSSLIMIAAVVALLIQSVFFKPFFIPTPSMVPSLLVGDYVLVQKLAYGLRLPYTRYRIGGIRNLQRGDIIVFTHGASHYERHYIKRIIGLPGDHIQVHGHAVSVNGEVLLHERVNPETESQFVVQYRETIDGHSHTVQYAKHEVQGHVEHDVADGQLFVLGDNRNQSIDSRVWGALAQDRVVGRVQRIIVSRDLRARDFRAERMWLRIH
jgi:signal peptidase I